MPAALSKTSTRVTGNIAFIQRGNCQFNVKVENAQNAGAIAVVVYNNDATLLSMAGDGDGIEIPAIHDRSG